METVTKVNQPIFVMGSPRSGTTFVTDWIGKVCENKYMEDPHFPVESAESWEFSSLDFVLKWCHIFQKADVLIERWPQCRFIHVVRNPLDVLYSITHPKEQSFPFRDFGDMRDTDRAIQWWSFHIQGCQQVTAWHRKHSITIHYEKLPEEKGRLESFLSCSLSDLKGFHPTSHGDLEFKWMNSHLLIEKRNGSES